MTNECPKMTEIEAKNDTNVTQKVGARWRGWWWSVTFEMAPLVLLVEGEEFAGDFADLGQRVLNTPDLLLVTKAVLAN